jgi:hypothetical protein
VALVVLWSLTVASGSALGVTLEKGGAYVPTARAEDPGTSESADQNAEKADKADKKKSQKEENCPQEKWVIALPIEGLACVLLLPKPPAEGEGQGGGAGGGGSAGGLTQ